MFEKYSSPHRGVGTIVNVSIDTRNQLIRREFKAGSVTVGGKTHEFDSKQVTEFFNNEVFWLDKLKSEWVPETVEVGNNFIIQKYYGPCLLDFKPNKEFLKYVPDIVDQVIEMYRFFKLHNAFKRNGSLSNLTHNNGQLVAFDFKWTKQRPHGKEMEIHSYNEWLSKIDSKLTEKLMQMID